MTLCTRPLPSPPRLLPPSPPHPAGLSEKPSWRIFSAMARRVTSDSREDGLEVVLVQDKVADEGTDGDLAAARGGGDGFVVREVGLEPSGHLLVVDDVSDVEESRARM